MIARIRIFIFLVSSLFQVAFLGKTNGVFYKSCGLCGGTVHTRINGVENRNTGIYDATFKCNKCGAIGSVHEEWKQQ